MPAAHPLAELLHAAAAGRFPPSDGSVRLAPAPPGLAGAVVAFTGLSVVAADVPQDAVRVRLASRDPFGGPTEAGFLVWLGERLGVPPDGLDLVLVHPGRDGQAAAGLRLRRREDLWEHPRVRTALRQRRAGLTVYAEEHGRGLATLGRGLVGRLELSVEVEPEHRGNGLGAAMVAAALALAPPGEPVFAQVNPGNASSVRAFLRAGFHPVGAEVLFVG